MLERLRPHPHRGDLVAAAVVPLTVAVVLLNVRMDDTWGVGIHFVITALATAFVAVLALLARMESDEPRAYQSVLFVAALVLLLITLGRLAQVLGADGFLGAPGTVTWVGLIFAAAAGWLALRRGSAVSALIAALAAGAVLLAFVDWVFSPDGPDTSRYLLIALIGAYVVAHLQVRGDRPRHAVQLVNAAGVAALVLQLTFLIAVVFGELTGGLLGGDSGAGLRDFSPGTGWELIFVAVGFGLIAYAAIDRERGPAYLGFLVLGLFVLLAGFPGEDGASVIGWPLLLLLLGGAGLAFGLRPLEPLPPEPRTGPDAPTVPVAPAAAPAPVPGPGPADPKTEPLRPVAPEQPADPPAEPPAVPPEKPADPPDPPTERLDPPDEKPS